MAKTRLPVITARFLKVSAYHFMNLWLLHLQTNTWTISAPKSYLLFQTKSNQADVHVTLLYTRLLLPVIM